MISQKIINILILLSIIAIIIFFYYNSDNKKIEESKKKVSKSQPHPSGARGFGATESRGRRRSQRERKRVVPKTSKKKVRFNDNIKYHYYDTNDQIGDKIDIDRILSQKKVMPGVLKDTQTVEIIDPQFSGSDLQDVNIVRPINLEQENADDTWDANFGLPLITKNESHNHFDKMQKSNRKYEQSMSEFTEYQVDRSSIVEPEFKIDPFKPSTKSAALKNQKIKDIYDMQVAAPKAAPKKIKKVTSDLITYENDSENNGGPIQGTNLHGFDGHSSIFGNAAFGNEF